MIIGISGKINSGKDTVASMIQYLDLKRINGYPSMSFEDFTKLSNYEHSRWKVKRFADKLKDMACMMIGCTREQLEDREFKEAPLGEEWDKYVIIPANKSEALIYCDREKAERAAKTYGLKMNRDGTIGSSLIERIPMTPRKLIQLLGTEAGRQTIHPNLWVNALFADWKAKNEILVECEYCPSRDRWIVPKGHGEHSGEISLHKMYMYYEDEKQHPNWIIPDTRFPNEAKAIRDRDGILIRVNRPAPDDSKRMEWASDKAYRTLVEKYCEDTSKYTEVNIYKEEELFDGENYKEEYQDEFNELYDTFLDRYVPPKEHPSEAALDAYTDWDYVIENDGNLDELLAKVKEIYGEIVDI